MEKEITTKNIIEEKPTEGVEKKKLTGIFDAIGWSFSFLFAEKRWLWLLQAQLMYYAVVVVMVLPAMVAVAMVGFMIRQGNLSWWAIGVLGVVAFVTMILMSGFSTAYYTGMFIEIYNDRRPNIFELVKQSWRKAFGFFGLSTVVGLVTLGGLMLLIVPGIIWSLTYMFTLNIKYEKEVGVGEAMKTSKALTRGYKWDLFKKSIGLTILMGIASAVVGGMSQKSHSILLSMVTVVGSLIITCVWSLIFVKYYYELKLDPRS